MNTSSDSGAVGPLVENLFRRESARLTAFFVRRLGPARASEAEDIVQETLLNALQNWRFKGLPDNPTAWLWRAAQNRMIDTIRRDTSRDIGTTALAAEPIAPAPPPDLPDAELALLFLCCDPALPRESAIPMTLELACGFGVGEVAGALGEKPGTISQRLVRARNQWKAATPELDIERVDLSVRLPAVLNTIYLMLSEGYGGHHPVRWQRDDICLEATRLALLLAENRRTASPVCAALAALSLFLTARLPARIDGEGDLVLLDDQDRSLWRADLTARAFHWLKQAADGTRETPYHLMAAIAACHAIAPTFDKTDWTIVHQQYMRLVEIEPESPYHKLGLAVAALEAVGADTALHLLSPLDSDRHLAGSYLLPATRAHVMIRCGRTADARRELIRAIDLAPSEQPRAALHRRLATLTQSATLT